jgi:hypothetical protein
MDKYVLPDYPVVLNFLSLKTMPEGSIPLLAAYCDFTDREEA